MSAPQAILDALTAVEQAKEQDDLNLQNVQQMQIALTTAQQDLAGAQQTQSQSDTALQTSLITLQQLIAAYYVPGGTLPTPPTPAPAPSPAS